MIFYGITLQCLRYQRQIGLVLFEKPHFPASVYSTRLTTSKPCLPCCPSCVVSQMWAVSQQHVPPHPTEKMKDGPGQNALLCRLTHKAELSIHPKWIAKLQVAGVRSHSPWCYRLDLEWCCGWISNTGLYRTVRGLSFRERFVSLRYWN